MRERVVPTEFPALLQCAIITNMLPRLISTGVKCHTALPACQMFCPATRSLASASGFQWDCAQPETALPAQVGLGCRNQGDTTQYPAGRRLRSQPGPPKSPPAVAVPTYPALLGGTTVPGLKVKRLGAVRRGQHPGSKCMGSPE